MRFLAKTRLSLRSRGDLGISVSCPFRDRPKIKAENAVKSSAQISQCFTWKSQEIYRCKQWVKPASCFDPRNIIYGRRRSYCAESLPNPQKACDEKTVFRSCLISWLLKVPDLSHWIFPTVPSESNRTRTSKPSKLKAGRPY